MIYAIISDVHSNIEALTAVLIEIKKSKIEEIFFLGDAVGYGPNPDECTKTVNDHCSAMILGNHDMAVLGLLDIEFFNVYAQQAIQWTVQKMNVNNKLLLKKFDMLRKISQKDIFLVHSTPKKPEMWAYIYTLWDAAENFHYFDTKICFVGHSHKPFIFEKKPSGEIVSHKERVSLSEGSRYLVNVGSVGQPRDRDHRACYCIVNEGAIFFRRVEYDIKMTQNKMLKYGLPSYLIERLSYGI